jgi:hypothetical protein
MKKIIFLVLLSGMIFSGCKKDSTDTPSNKGQFTINSKTYNFSDMLWSENGTTTIYYRIESFDNLDNEIVIEVPTKTIGDYNFNDTNVSVDLTIGTDIYNSVTATGKVTITKSDASVVQGTFTGKFTNKTTTVDATGSFTANKFAL